MNEFELEINRKYRTAIEILELPKPIYKIGCHCLTLSASFELN